MVGDELADEHSVTLPPQLLAALASHLATATFVHENPLVGVYDARTAEGRRIALHIVAPSLVALVNDPAHLAAALREMPTLTGLTLPAIEWIHHHDGFVCYGTAWHDGMPVHVVDRASSPPAQALALAGRELSRELDALHRRGLAHGMITTRTLTYAPDNARFVLEGTGLIAALKACGVEGTSIPGVRADMLGVGEAMYELLTGCPPFGGRTTGTVMAAVLRDQRTGETVTASTAALTEVILRCLEKDAAERWPDFSALANALASAARDPEARGGSIARASGEQPRPLTTIGRALLGLVRRNR